MGPLKQNLSQPKYLGAVRVTFDFAQRMMFAVYGNPLLGEHAGRHPDPQPEKMSQHRVQIDAAMSLVTMQIQCDAHDGDLYHYQRDDYVTDKREIKNAV